jgi:hypothetical protein
MHEALEHISRQVGELAREVAELRALITSLAPKLHS